MGEKKKSGRGKSIFILLVCAGLGAAASHFVYGFVAESNIKAELTRLGKSLDEVTYKINYGNVPHMEYLVYGVIGGLILGLVVMFMSSKKKK